MVSKIALTLGVLVVLGGCDSITGVVVDREVRLAAIYTASTHSCGLTASGETYCWGNTAFSQGPAPARLATKERFKALSVSDIGSCGLTVEGELHCWHGEEPTPTRRFPDRRFGAIARAFGHSNCAVGPEGEALCWGPLYGGCQPLMCPDVRVVATEDPLVSVASGHWYSLGGSHDPHWQHGHTCGLAGDGTAHCWGENNYVGGSGPIEGIRFTSIDTGQADSCGLDADGFAYCWGTLFGTTPTKVADIRFSMISLGGFEVCGLSINGSVYCWGRTSAHAQIPTKIPTDVKFASISVSPQVTSYPGVHACGLTTSGEAYCWGQNRYGQLGVPDGMGTSEPQPVRQVVFN
jgi:alpha-tubulin suppressor-like RCC1 family protein